MYKNLQFGNNSAPAHNVRDLNTGLKRIELTGAFFYTAPGPKMLWQFGELGYDFSINHCPDGTVSTNCRTDKKPIRWDYRDMVQRKRVYDVFAALNKLRAHAWYKDVFIANNTTIDRNLGGAFKTLRIRSALDSSCIVVIGNFDVTPQTGQVVFPVAGTWYNYLTGATTTATGAAQSFTLQPGDYLVLLNRNLVNTVITSSGGGPSLISGKLAAKISPNPVTDNSLLEIKMPKTAKAEVILFDAGGRQLEVLFSGVLAKGARHISLQGKIDNLPAGSYYTKLNAAGLETTIKFIIQ
jgi:hypothetical protein